MINSVTLVGRAGSDPEIKKFNSGAELATINMACTRPTKEKETDWFTIQIWGKQVEVAKNYLKKGNLFGIVGTLRQEHWEKDGNKHSKVVVIAEKIRLLNPKNDSSKTAKPEGESQDFFGDDSQFQ